MSFCHRLLSQRPAVGLDQRRPIDLLTTPAGVELVEEHLGRLEYGYNMQNIARAYPLPSMEYER